MNNRTTVVGALGIVALTVIVWGAYRLGTHQRTELGANPMARGMESVPQLLEDPGTWTMAQGGEATRRHMTQGIAAGDIDPVTGREVLHYYDPMMPASKFDAPAKSPFMDMMLVPAYASTDASDDAGSIAISARMRQNTGIRSTEVREGSLTPLVNAVGTVVWNERDEVLLQARAQGYVERLQVRAAFDPVERGQVLLELRVPAWVALQEESLALQRMQGANLAPLLEASRARMLQAGMDATQIRRFLESGAVQERMVLQSPVRGVVTELGVREGMTVTPGMTLFRINGTATVWAEAAVPESQVALLEEGSVVVASSSALPGARFEGRIQALLPEIDLALRTRTARMVVANPQGLLVPGMLMTMELAAVERAPALLVPTDAVISTGPRTVVMLDEGDGWFRPVDVETGIEWNGKTEILAGLRAGQRVVTSGQFLLDSEASLRGLEARSAEMPVAGDTP